MVVKTSRQVMERHIEGLLERERYMVAKLRRVESGLAALRELIAVERRALSPGAEPAGVSAPPRAA